MLRPMMPPRTLLNRSIAFALGLAASAPASANPQGMDVVSGTAATAMPNPQTLEITNSPGAILNWQGFDIGAGETTRFIQQDAASAVLNRVTTQNSSEIFGQLVSNGRVFLINSAGILIGRDAVVDTAGLVMSTLNITDADFAAGRFKFQGGPDSGTITNHGYIKSAPNGEIILIAPKIVNAPLEGNPQSGLIESENGELVLAAGHAMTISSLDDPDVSFEVQAPADEVVNIGQLLAHGGTASVLAGTIRHSGEINADALSVDATGKVVLTASHRIETSADSVISARGEALRSEPPVTATAENAAKNTPRPVAADGGTVLITAAQPESKDAASAAPDTTSTSSVNLAGRVDVTGRRGGAIHVDADDTHVSGALRATGNARGGRVEILGEHVTLTGATVAADAEIGAGGDIRVGGEYQGGAALRAAATTSVDAASRLSADAGGTGQGGRIITWSDELTTFTGKASARGGATAGDGGFVEVSGKETLRFTGGVDVGAPGGKGGTLLLDPRNVFIVPGGASVSVDNPTPFSGDGFGSSFTVLGNGNILAFNQNADANGATDAGEVVLLDGFGNLLASVAGTATNQRLGSSGFFNVAGGLLILDPNAPNGAALQAGRVFLLNDDTGQIIGQTLGGSAGEQFGSAGDLEAFFGGNLLFSSPDADIGGIGADVGLVSLISGTTGLEIGRITGQSANENFGSLVTNLGSNFLVRSQLADVGAALDAGAVVLGSGTTGLEIGRVSGAATGDQFGAQVDLFSTPAGTYLIRSNLADVGGLTDNGTAVLVSRTTGTEIGRASGLSNNDHLGTFAPIFDGTNYFLQVPDSDFGAFTDAGSLVLVSGTTGQRIGAADGGSTSEFFSQNGISIFGANLLILISDLADTAGGIDAGSVVAVNRTTGAIAGRVDGTSAGERLGSFGLIQRSNGNYFIPSPLFNTASGQADAGSVILADGNTGNLLGRFDGTSAGEQFGSTRFDFSLSNEDTLVVAPLHGGGTGIVAQLAASDLGGGNILRGSVTGSASGDLNGVNVIFRPFGNYVVAAPNMDVSSTVDAGSVFAVEDTTGATLLRIDGNQATERLGSVIQTNIFDTLGGTLADTFAILSPSHGLNSEGAVFFVNSEAGVLTRQIDGNTSETLGTQQLLVVPGGNIAIRSPFESSGFLNEGAITFVNAFNNFVTTGTVTGISANERLGGANTTFDLSSLGGGKFLINTPDRDVSGKTDAGAVLMMQGTPGSVTLLGAISGLEASDRLGEDNAVQVLGNGNFVLFNHNADNPAGPVGVTDDEGTIILVDAVNFQEMGGTGNGRFYGQAPGEELGLSRTVFETLSGNGNYYAASPTASPGAVSNAGSLYLLNGTSGHLIGQANGDTAGESFGNTLDRFTLFFSTAGSTDSLVRSASGHGGGGTIVQVADHDLGGGNIIRNRLDGAVGSGAAEGLGGFSLQVAPDGLHYFVRSPNADAGAVVDAGSVYFVDIATGALSNRVDGVSPGENFGTFGNTGIFQFGTNLFMTSELADAGPIIDAGRVLLVGSAGNLIGSLTGNNANEQFGSNFQFVGSDLWVFAPLHSNGAATGAGGIFAIANQDLGGGNILRASLQGGASGDALGTFGANFVAGGNAMIRVPLADVGGVTDAGAAILVNSSLQEIGRTTGTSTNEQFSATFFNTLSNGNFLFRSANADINGLVDAGTVKLVSKLTGTLIGQTSGVSANEFFGASGPLFLVNNGLAFVSSGADVGGLVDAGAIVQINPETGLEIQRVVGLSANENLGSFGFQSLSGGRLAFGSPLADVNGVIDSGRILIFDPTGANQGAAARNLLFTDTPAGDFVLTTGSIEAALAAGANLILQANNDIVIQKDVVLTGGGGSLTLQAGRSILVNGLLNMPGTDLKLLANQGAAEGVDLQARGAGAGEFVLEDPQVVGRTIELSAQAVRLFGGSDPASVNVLQTSSELFANFLDNGILDAPATFVLGIEKLAVTADEIQIVGGGSPGAFAALASMGEFTVDAGNIVLEPGTAPGAHALFLGLGGLGEFSFKTCTGCGDTLLFTDPFLEDGPVSGLFIAGLFQDPAVNAILAMLGRDSNDDDEDDDDDKDVKECGI